MYFVINHVLVWKRPGMAVRCGFTKWTDDLLSVGTVNPKVLLFLGIVSRKCILCEYVFGSSDLN